MASLWPWLAIAGLGAVHGLSPANGWMFAAAWGVGARDSRRARQALLPIAIGHIASIAVVAGVFALGLSLDRTLFQGLAGALLIGAASYRWLRRAAPRTFPPSRPRVGCPGARREGTPVGTLAGHAGIALWAFLMATAHGAGLMLVPALAPLCLSGSPARELTGSGSLALALAAVAVHTAAMLVTTGVIATGVCRRVVAHARRPAAAGSGSRPARPPRASSEAAGPDSPETGAALRQAWTVALAVTGVLMMVLR